MLRLGWNVEQNFFWKDTDKFEIFGRVIPDFKIRKRKRNTKRKDEASAPKKTIK